MADPNHDGFDRAIVEIFGEGAKFEENDNPGSPDLISEPVLLFAPYTSEQTQLPVVRGQGATKQAALLDALRRLTPRPRAEAAKPADASSVPPGFLASTQVRELES